MTPERQMSQSLAWFCRGEVLAELAAQREAREGADLEEARARIDARRAERDGPMSLFVLGSVAEIRVEGVLTMKPDLWLEIFGVANTAYEDLLAAIEEVRSDASIREVEVIVDSPGGSASGLYETMDAFAQLRSEKTVRVKAASAHSAAYGIAAVAGPIEAKSDASMFGSVGVAVSFWVSDFVLELTNSESPDKRPNLKTDEGRAVVVRELDALFDLFATRIAAGRGVARDEVAETFGRGASFVAHEAERRGMIDSVRAGRSHRDSAGAAKAERGDARASVQLFSPSAVMTESERALVLGEALNAAAAATTHSTKERPMANSSNAAESSTTDDEETSETPEAESEPTTADAPAAVDDEEDEDEEMADDVEEDEESPIDGPADEDEEEDASAVANRRKLATLEGRVASLTSRARELLGDDEATLEDALSALHTAQLDRWVDEQCARAGATLTAEERADVVDLARSGKEKLAVSTIDRLGASRQKPPSTSVLAAHGIQPKAGKAPKMSPASLDEAAVEHAEAARAELGPNAPDHHIHAYAKKLAAKAHPELAPKPERAEG